MQVTQTFDPLNYLTHVWDESGSLVIVMLVIIIGLMMLWIGMRRISR